jgi:putative glutamine amidotransferase
MAKIGIASSFPNEPARVATYTRAVERAGAGWVLFRNDLASLDAQLEAVDGVLLTGGQDVDPAEYRGRRRYPGAPLRFKRERDRFEIALARTARDRRIPALCICRGLQVANVAFGGTLIEDVPSEFGKDYAIHHRQTEEDGLARSDYARDHEVRLVPGSRIAEIAGTTALRTNSLHHQAVRTTGDGFVVAGRTSDGVVEALDATFDHPFFVAVQWHPEELDDEPSRRLFAGLVTSGAQVNAREA